MGFAAGLNAGSSMIERGMKMRQIKQDREKQAKYEEALKQFEMDQEALKPPKQSAATDNVQSGQGLSFAEQVGAGLDGAGTGSPAPVRPQPPQASAPPPQAMNGGLSAGAGIPSANPQPSAPQQPPAMAAPQQSPAMTPPQGGLSGQAGMAGVPQQEQPAPLQGVERARAMRAVAMKHGNIEDAKYFDTQIMQMENQDLARKQYESLNDYRQWTMQRTDQQDAYQMGRDAKLDRANSLTEISQAGAMRAAAGELAYNEALDVARQTAKTPEERAKVDVTFYNTLAQQEGVKPAEIRRHQEQTLKPLNEFLGQEFENPDDEIAAAEQILASSFDSDVTDGIPVTIRPLQNGGVAVMEGDRVVAQGASAKEIARQFQQQVENDKLGFGISAFQNNKKKLDMAEKRAKAALDYAKIDKELRIEASKRLADLRNPEKTGGKVLTPAEYEKAAAQVYSELGIDGPYKPLNAGAGDNESLSTIISGFKSRDDVLKMRDAISHIDPNSPMGRVMHQAVNMGLEKYGGEEAAPAPAQRGGLDPDPNRVPFGERLMGYFSDPEGADTRRLERRN